MPYHHISVPDSDKVSIADGKLNASDHPILPFIEDDGTPVWDKAEN